MSGNRLILQAQGITDIKGNCKLSFQEPPMGMAFTGALTVYNSPLSITWMIKNAGQVIDVALGTTTVSGIQAYPGETITVEGSNLIPGTIVQATWVVIQDSEENTIPATPQNDSIQAILTSSQSAAVAVPSPGQGVSPVYTFVQAGQLVSVYFLFQASSATGTRTIGLSLQTALNGSIIFSEFSPTTVTAGGITQYSAGIGLPNSSVTGFIGLLVTMPLQDHIIVQPGWQLNFNGIQDSSGTGDQFLNMFLTLTTG